MLGLDTVRVFGVLGLGVGLEGLGLGFRVEVFLLSP